MPDKVLTDAISGLPVIQRGNPISGAVFSTCLAYRYVLWRNWDESLGSVMFIGLNPSTADESYDDPTIRRCKRFAIEWGYGGIYMTNLFAFRATEPEVMKAADEPIGPANDTYLRELHEWSGLTIAAWGVHGAFKGRDRDVCKIDRRERSRKLSEDLFCLGLTKEGFPRHPLYVRADQKPVWFRAELDWRIRIRSRLCCFCGDTAEHPLGPNRWCCDDCWQEIRGNNGLKYLNRCGKGHKGQRVLDENSSGGPAGRMGHGGVGGNLWDDIVRASEEDQ